MSKETLRKAIQRHTREFLARGGVIEVVPRVIQCPKNMDWARKRGWDYTPWNVLGGMGGMGDGVSIFEVQNLGEGCYLTMPARFEGSEDR